MKYQIVKYSDICYEVQVLAHPVGADECDWKTIHICQSIEGCDKFLNDIIVEKRDAFGLCIGIVIREVEI